MRIRATSPATQELLQAAADGCLETLVDKTSNDNNDTRLCTVSCSSGCKALHWAAGNGHGHVVEFLLKAQRHDDAEGGARGAAVLFDVDCPAVGKSQGRTALHYACRNGHYDMMRKLVEEYGAEPNAKARHGVTPLQLAVWQGRLKIAQYLVEKCHVDPHQTNDFECGLVHWMGLAPKNSPLVVEMARWLYEDIGLPLRHVVQRQGHSALHKAAWGGHLELCRYLHETVGIWDDQLDAAGNYAADLARMAQHESALVDYLQRVASHTTFAACQLLLVSLNAEDRTVPSIQRAYRNAVRTCHPDGKERRRRLRQTALQPMYDFDLEEEKLVARFQELTQAYRHLIACATNDQDNEKLLENHASHELPHLLTLDGSNPTEVDENCFEARLLQVVRQNRHGLDLSNLIKKWKQVWPGVDFPTRPQISLHQWLRQKASHVVTIRADDRGVLRLYSRQ